MNNQIRRFYTVSVDNEIIMIDTNLNSFWRRLTGQDGDKCEVGDFRYYRAATWFVTRFKESRETRNKNGCFSIDRLGKLYNFQEIIVV